MYVSSKLQTKHLDEDAIRKAFLDGQYPGALADSHGTQDRGRVAELIMSNRDRWVSEDPFDRERSDERRILRRKIVIRNWGYKVIHVPLPRVSMHVAAMEGRP